MFQRLIGFVRKGSPGLLGAALATVIQGCGPLPDQSGQVSQVDSVPGQLAVEPATILSGDGGTLDLAAYRGKVVLVNFWATWSEPCVREIPTLNEWHRGLADEGLVIVGTMVDEGSPDVLRASVHALGVEYPVALANQAWMAQFTGSRAVPTKVLLDREGRVAQTYAGGVANDVLLQAVERILAQ